MADSSQYNLSLVITANNKAVEELNKLWSSVEKVKWWVLQLSESTKKTLKTVWATATAVAWSVALLWKSFIDSALENEPLQRSFERLSESANISSKEMLDAMRKASKWTVADTKLMASANTALSLNVVQSADDMATLMEIARVKWQAMWRSMEEALDDIVRWLWRASPMILDNLWIVINQTEAQEEYAKSLWKTASELTEAEKKQALVNAVVKQWKKELAETWDLQLTMAERLQVVNAQRENMKNTIWDALLPVVQKVLEVITPMIQKVADRINEHPKLTANILLTVWAISWLIAIISWLALALPSISTAISVLSWPIWRIIWAVALLWTARVNNRWWIQEKTQAVVDRITEIVQPRLDKLSARRDKRWWVVMEVVKWLRSFVEDAFVSAFEVIWAWLEIFFQSIDVILNIFSWNREEARNWICNIRTTLRDTTMSVVDNLFWDALDRIADKLVSFWDRFNQKRNAIKNRVLWVANAMREWLKQWFQFRIALFTWDRETVWQIATEQVSNIDSVLTAWFWQTRTNIKNWLQWFIDDVVSKFTALKDKVKSIVDSIKNMWNSAKEWVSWAVSSARDFVSSPFKAWWWDVYWWQSYIVWEKWPELFVPKQSWTITPTNQITNNNWIEININWAIVRNDNDIKAIADEIIRQVKLEKNFWIA